MLRAVLQGQAAVDRLRRKLAAGAEAQHHGAALGLTEALAITVVACTLGLIWGRFGFELNRRKYI